MAAAPSSSAAFPAPSASRLPDRLRDRLRRGAFALAVALLVWSFVAGCAYLLVLSGGLPLRTDSLAGARTRAARGDVAGALREYRMAARIDGSDLRATVEMGQLLVKSGRPAEAEVAFADVLRRSPDDRVAKQGLADVRLAQDRYGEAIGLYLELLAQPGSRDPQVLNNLGIAWASSGELGRAIQAFSEALALEPGSAQFAGNLARARAELTEAQAGKARR